MDLSSLPVLVVVAEQRGQLLSFVSSHDPYNTITEGQLSFMQMEMKWNARAGELMLNKVIQLSSGEWIYLTNVKLSEQTFIYGIISPSQDNLVKELIEGLDAVAKRTAVYTAEELYDEVLDTQLATTDPMKLISYSPNEALSRLREIAVNKANLESIALLLQLLSDYDHIDDPVVYAKTMELLNQVDLDDELIDEYLDAANVIADKLYQRNQLSEALKIYDAITEHSDDTSRMALNLNCRLRAAQIVNELKQGADPILDRIGSIDDGSLNMVSHASQVLFFTLQGAAYDQLGDFEQASAYHEMAIAISKTEIIPSIYFASSYGFMAKMDAKKLRPDLATSKFLTASNIARNHEDMDLADYYADQAAKQELIWADILRSTAAHYNMIGKRSDATFSIWQSIRKVVDSYIHGSRDFHRDGKGIGISETIIEDGITLVNELNIEFGEDTLKTVSQQLGLVQKSEIPKEQQSELLRFLTSRISNMIPLPPPIIMIISLDGRLLLGGEIGGEKSTWNQMDGDLNVLFSGALTAIMAMLSEVISEENPLRMLDVGQTQIMIEKTETCIGTVLVDRELVVLRKALKESLRFIQNEFPDLRDTIKSYSINLHEAIPVIEQIFIEALNSF